MKGIWATTTIKIFLFLDSNNVFENKVGAALMCSHYSKASFMLFISVLFVTVALINCTYHNIVDLYHCCDTAHFVFVSWPLPLWKGAEL